MTFHTFEVGTCLKGLQFKNINNDFKKYSSQYFNDPNIDDRKIFIGLSTHGILIYIYKRQVDYNSFVYYITYRINPVRIIDSTDYINLFHSNDSYKIHEMVNEKLKSISSYIPQLNECSLQRFDFCTNIVLKNSEEVKNFIRLINASYIPNEKVIQKKNYDKRSGRFVIPKEEATFTHGNYVEVSFYNKIHQLESERLPIEFYDDILRCEIRCQKPYITNLQKKFNVTDIEDFFYMLPQIGNYVYNTQLKKLNLSYDYLHLNEIYDKIENAAFKRKTKDKMKLLAKTASKHKGIENAVKSELVFNIKDIIKKFSKIGIASMPLSSRSKISSEINLLELCLRFADAKSI